MASFGKNARFFVCLVYVFSFIMHCRVDGRRLVLPQSARLGYPVIDLGNHVGDASVDVKNDYAHYFAMDNLGTKVLTKKSLNNLLGASIILDLILKSPLSDGTVLERVETLTIQIIADEYFVEFPSPVHSGTIDDFSTSSSYVKNLEKIKLKSGKKLENVRYTIADDDGTSLFKVVTVLDDEFTNEKYIPPYAQIRTRRKLTSADRGFYIFTLIAESSPPGNRAETKIEITVDEKTSAKPKILANRRYIASIPWNVTMGTRILDVRKRHWSNDDFDLTYHLEPSNVPFDVDPFTGEVFTTDLLDSERYSFDVVAVDGAGLSNGNSSYIAAVDRYRTAVKVIVDLTGNNKFMKKNSSSSSSSNDCDDGNAKCDTTSRYKRALRPEISMNLFENHPTSKILAEKISLSQNERIKDAPIEKEFLTVNENGTMILTRSLNYETVNPVQVTVLVQNVITMQDSPQRIVINVLDVDEKPRFINQPVPFLAVVPVEVPVAYTAYKFTAKDEDGDGDSDIEYKLISTEPPDSFTIDPKSGSVKTARNRYEPGKTYLVYVQAVDVTWQNVSVRISDVAKLDIKAGTRPPQFFQESYRVSVAENTQVSASVAQVKAASFANNDQIPIRFSLIDLAGNGKDKKSDSFSMDEQTGVVYLLKKLDYDDPLERRLYNLKVVATEGSQTSEVPLEIEVSDVNDNDPTFTQPLYTASINEDHPVGSKILLVSARDKDSGKNAEIVYSVDNSNFTVDRHGQIMPRLRLDADQKQQGVFIYRFNVIARDKGDPSRTTSSQIQIKTQNVNDEAPFFVPTSLYTDYVAEDAQGNTPILYVQAQDPDRDQVKYSFIDVAGSPTNTFLHFEIDTDTGLIKLKDGIEPEQLRDFDNSYELFVIAVDDSSCCTPRTTVIHTSTATVRVGVKDINNNKPLFKECDSYSKLARVPEGKHKNYTIIKVLAVDQDSGQNGDIVYSLYYPGGDNRRPFVINPRNGELYASAYVEFDREERPFEDVTVKATDKGSRPLIGFCHFTVTVEDENDNSPEFDRANYEASVSRSTPVGQSVLTVFADDRDGPSNSKITYSLKSDPNGDAKHIDDVRYFRINDKGGEIILTSPIPAEKTQLVFFAIATDNGAVSRSSQAKISIDVTDSAHYYPIWKPSDNCKDQKIVEEDLQVNSIVFECYAVSGLSMTNAISYSMRNGQKAIANSNGDFREFQTKKNGNDWVVIRVLKPLDYEKTKDYELTISATDIRNGLSKDKVVKVLLRDKNDNVPKFKLDKFIGQVEEEKEVADLNEKPLVTVEAVDKDKDTPAFRDITYSILPGASSHLFRIDSKTGAIYALQSFDREKNDSFILDVQAEDGAPSDLPGSTGPNRALTKVQIVVQDINDNAPYFNETMYNGRVRENAEVQQNVMTVKAHDLDKDSELRYSLGMAGNDNNSFAVYPNSGTIFVSSPLDYERKKIYHLTLFVTDGMNGHQARTNITIEITDVNDNSPQFEQPQYATSIQEEDTNVPKRLLQVRAFDRDDDPASKKIVYRLVGQGANKEFTINEFSGEIYAAEPLDRDPPNGIDRWNFVVQAIDDGGNGLVGYADILVVLTDINDNKPVFEGGPFVGYVTENQEINDAMGVYVRTMTATDHDDSRTPNAKLTYDIQRNKFIGQKPVFKIDSQTGKIFALMKLDRENNSQREFEIEIKATDQGKPHLSGVGSAIIKVLDVNDNPPYFDPPTYVGSVKETAPVNSPVMSLSAKDPDNEAKDNVLHYSLVPNGQLGLQYFYISTEQEERGSSVMNSNVGIIRVKQPLDFEDKLQKDGFNITVNVTDGRFSATADVHIRLQDQNDNPPQFTKHSSSVSIKENLSIGSVVFKFTAVDKDFNGQDPFHFYITHESDPLRQFNIGRQNGSLTLAKPLDREIIPSYRLNIVAEDESGNKGNTFLNVYLDDVNDNAPYFNLTKPLIVWENMDPPQNLGPIYAYDPDAPTNGPPFKFTYPNPTPGIKIENSSTTSINVATTERFDREGPQGKVLNVMVNICDKHNLCADRVLPIIIGDVNDSPMSNGESTINVYNYKGELRSTVIGRVYVTDADDWDIKDKLFRWKDGGSPYFDLNQEGLITINERVPYGTYVLKVAVTDNVKKETADGIVNVVVEYLSEEAVANAGSVRISGITAEDFLGLQGTSDSPYRRVREELARLLKVDQKNVQIFSVQPYKPPISYQPSPPFIDVHFAAFGSPYKSSILLNGLIDLSRNEFDQLIDRGRIEIVNIDPCVDETCVNGGCTRKVIVNNTPAVVMANKTSLVGVSLNVTAVCECPRTDVPMKCQLKGASPSCLNAGICHNVQSEVKGEDAGFFCECRGPYRGPRCEGRTRSFDGGNSYVWLNPLGSCDTFNVSFEFMTSASDGILLYNGPMTRPSTTGKPEPSDALAIYIEGGYLTVDLNLGGGNIKSKFNNKQVPQVNDGEWHIIDIFAAPQQDFTVILDRCKNSGDASSVQSQCMVKEPPKGSNQQLNVNKALQLGGIAREKAPPPIDNPNLKGCIRNLYVNGDLYDLNNVLRSSTGDTSSGCQQAICSSKGKDWCLNGECLASLSSKTPPVCICDPGWTGEQCDKETKWKYFGSQSFVQYEMLNDGKPLPKNWAKLKVMFATPKIDSGELIRITDSYKTKFMNVELDSDRVAYAFQFNAGEGGVISPPFTLKAKKPYMVEVDRFMSYSKITVDGLSGSYSATRAGGTNETTTMEPNPKEFYLGAASNSPLKNEDFQGCIREFHWNNEHIDILNGKDKIVQVSNSFNVMNDGCKNLSAALFCSVPCVRGLVCVNFWKGPFCTCPPNVAVHFNDDGTIDNCGEMMAMLRLGITNGAVAAILISLLALIILVLILVIYSRRRRKPPSIQEDLISRENIRGYNEEGGGEEDQDNYNIGPLRKPVLPTDDIPQGMLGMPNGRSKAPKAPPEGDLDAFLRDRIHDADTDPSAPPFDELRVYTVEDDGISVASLSSLSSTGSDVDWDGLNQWGPRFRKLADMYSGGEAE